MSEEISIKRNRYTLSDVSLNRFYQIPKFLFENSLTTLTNDARVLYSLLKDRHELSIQNKWINDAGEVFIIFTRDDMCALLGCSQPTLRKAITQLKDAGLIDEERQGLNRPNLIYLYYYIPVNNPVNPDEADKTEPPMPNEADKNAPASPDSIRSARIFQSGVKESFSPECKDFSVKNESLFQSRAKDSYTQECKDVSGNDTDINDTNISNTDINNTDINYIANKNTVINNKSINRSTSKRSLGFNGSGSIDGSLCLNNRDLVQRNIDYDRLVNDNYRYSGGKLDENLYLNNRDLVERNIEYNRLVNDSDRYGGKLDENLYLNNRDLVRKNVDYDRLVNDNERYGGVKLDENLYLNNRDLVKKNIDYDLLVKDDDRYSSGKLDEIIDIITGVLCSSRGTIRIAGEDLPAKLVKDQLLKLRADHINYVSDSLRNSKTEISNIKAYLITALCNAPSTIMHFRQKVEISEKSHGKLRICR